MWTIILSAGFGLVVGLGLGFSGTAHWGWSIFWGLAGFGASQVSVMLVMRGRIKRLQHDNLISFTAITGLELASKSRLGKIRVQAEAVRQRELANLIGQMSPVNAVLLTMGSFNILAMCLFEELDELADLASDHADAAAAPPVGDLSADADI